MLLAPNGIVNFLASTDIEWLASPSWRSARSRSSTSGPVTRSSWSACSRAPGHPERPLRGGHRRRREPGAALLERHDPQLRPIIVSLVLLDLIWTSQHFALIWLTTGGGPIDVTEMLSTIHLQARVRDLRLLSLASTSAVLVLAMSMILAVLYVRHQKARD